MSITILSVSVSFSLSDRTHSYTLWICVRVNVYSIFSFAATIVRCVHTTKNGDTIQSYVLEFIHFIHDRRHFIFTFNRMCKERKREEREK